MSQRLFALADCNSCYASAETIFRPWLREQAVVVLSNNDGNCIARNAEAKRLGVAMGQPWHELKDWHRQGRLHVFSANFALYQDISNRVMTVLERHASAMEVYSIDEAWLDCTGRNDDLLAWGYGVREDILRQVGMPVGIGIGASKTLSKLANWAAKRWQRQTGGVVDIREPRRLEKLLKVAPVSEVWGIGPRLTRRLMGDMHIRTAWDLATADRRLLRRAYGVVVERTSRELLGEVCYELAQGPEPRQMIASTRSFGQRIYDLPRLSSAVATFTARAAEKLRQQGSMAQCLQVFAQTSAFASGRPYQGARIMALPYPSSDTRDLVQVALTGLQDLYREGPAYAKAGVILSQFVPSAHYTGDLFQPGPRPQSDAAMQAMDAINARMGRGAIRVAREQATQGWEMRQAFLGPCYTTRWSDLIVAR